MCKFIFIIPIILFASSVLAQEQKSTNPLGCKSIDPTINIFEARNQKSAAFSHKILAAPGKYSKEKTYFIGDKTAITLQQIKNIKIEDANPSDFTPIIRFEMTSEGSKIIKEVTKSGNGSQSLIVLGHGKVVSVARINAPIDTENFQLTLGVKEAIEDYLKKVCVEIQM